jgi:hypothetical protein
MCCGIHAKRHATGDAKPRIARRLGKSFCTGKTLGRSIPAADNGKHWRVQQIALSFDIEKRRRIGDIE